MSDTTKECFNKYIGKEFDTNQSGKCFVINYKSGKEVTVMFYDGYYVTTQMSNVRKGTVKNPFSKSARFHGFGVTDVPAMVSGSRNKYARLWESMITRVLSGRDKAYSNVEIQEDWALLSNFLRDISEFKGYDKVLSDKWVLDKDILSLGNKIYSKDTCCFVPRELNAFMINYNKPKGDYAIGVHFCNREKKYVAQAYKDAKQRFLGYYDSEQEAHKVYMKSKQDQLTEILNKYGEELDTRVVVSLKEKFKLID